MKILAIAIIGLSIVNAMLLKKTNDQDKRIDELEEKQRIQEAFDESEAK